MSHTPISVLVCEPMSPEGLLILSNHPNTHVDNYPDLKREQLIKIIERYDALWVRSQTQVNQEIILAGTKLKLIGRAGVGVNNIDLACAEKNNIAVINTPTGNSISTAEFTLGLMLALMRKIPDARNHILEGSWKRNLFKGQELAQKTLGIIGFGNIGRLVSARAKAFDMRVIAHDPLIERSVISDYGAEKLSLEEIFSQTDILSLHCGLNQNTQNLISKNTISQMKPGIKIINTARGELINDQDVLSGLQNNIISGLALDVFTQEPPEPKSKLVRHERVLVTPHLGASTHEAQKRVSKLLAEQTIAFFSKKSSQFRVA